MASCVFPCSRFDSTRPLLPNCQQRSSLDWSLANIRNWRSISTLVPMGDKETYKAKGWLVNWLHILFVRYCLLLLIIALSNQYAHILPRVIHTRNTLVLTILFVWKKLTVPFQPTTRQKLQSGQLNLPPNVRFSLVAEIHRHHAANHHLQGTQRKEF